MEEVLNVALATDQLVERTPMHRCVDIAAEIFEGMPLYTLAHRPGQVLGPVEQRRIISTFLSKQCSSLAAWHQRFFYFRSAAGTLHVPCTSKLLLALSRGAGHGAKTCDKTYKLVYLYDWQSLEAPSKPGLRWKIFSPMIKHWSYKNLANANEVWVSHASLQEQLSQHGIASEVVPPPIELQEFPMLPIAHLPKDYVVLHTQGMQASQALSFVAAIEQLGLRYVWVGDHPSWMKEVSAIPEKLFWGERCSGELAPLLAGARGVIDLSQELHPHLSLKALSCGTPVLSSHRGLPPGTSIAWQEKRMNDCLQQLVAPVWDSPLERQRLHQSVQHYKEVFFRQRLVARARALGVGTPYVAPVALRHDEARMNAPQ